MNLHLEKHLEKVEREAILKHELDFIQRLDGQINDLRCRYIKNKEQIKVAEIKSLQLADSVNRQIDRFKA